MADAPTIGGYRILGGVIWTDIALLSQRLPGETIQLEPVSVQVAQRAMAERFDSIDRVREWALA
jgi:allophanate hydrolase subunit 2